MKLRDRKVEKDLIALAEKSSGEGKIDSKDSSIPSASSILTKLFGYSFAGWVIFAISGFLGSRPLLWREFIVSLILILVAMTGKSVFDNIANRIGFYNILVNLPIRGEQALRAVRRKFFLRYVPMALGVSLITSFLLYGSFENPVQLIATALLLTGSTLSTVTLLEEPVLRRLFIPQAWLCVITISVILCVGFLFVEDSIFGIGAASGWVKTSVELLTWIFPASWVMPSRFQSGGFIPTILWFVWGYCRWRDLPSQAGGEYDRPRDYFSAFGNFGLEEEWEEDYEEEERISKENQIAEEEAAGSNFSPLESLKNTTQPIVGWVDLWVVKTLNQRDAVIALAMNGGCISFTKRTHLFLFCAPLLIALAWLFWKFVPVSHFKDMLFPWLVASVPLVTLVLLLPFSNGLPRATWTIPLGTQNAPLFAGLPISIRDILRVSTRITLARSLILVFFGTPILFLHFTFLGMKGAAIGASIALPTLAILWILSRPLFVFYRTYNVAKPRKGFRFASWLLTICALLLAPLWIAGIFAGGLTAYIYQSGDLTEPEIPLNFLIFSCGLFVCGIASRVVFEGFLALVRWRNFDWHSND